MPRHLYLWYNPHRPRSCVRHDQPQVILQGGQVGTRRSGQDGVCVHKSLHVHVCSRVSVCVVAVEPHHARPMNERGPKSGRTRE
jgi:hypothetical protein